MMQALLTDYILADTLKVQLPKVRTTIPSLGLAIPYQPCMQDKETIQNHFRSAAASVRAKMEDIYDEDCIKDVLARLEKLLTKLNNSSHCKSISLLLSPNEEKILYLNFAVKPITFVSEHVSLLQLTANAERQHEFYLLLLKENTATIYEYAQNRLGRVYIDNQSIGLDGDNDPADLFKRISQTINLLNSKDDKPIFVTGSPNIVELFYNSPYYRNIFFTLLYEVAPFCEEKRKSYAKEISSHWDYWQSKFITGRILIAQSTNCLLGNPETVLPALKSSTDGWLLLDKNFKRQLYKSGRLNARLNTSDELMNQIERFLIRGNRLQITESGLLDKFGGIVLLKTDPSNFTVK